MAYRTVGQDCSCTLNIGGAWDGTVNLEGANSVKGIARSIRLDDSISVHEVGTALGDTTRKIRPQRASYRCEIEMYVESTGIIAIDEGEYAQVVFNELSGLGSNHTYNGLVISTSLDVPDGPQVQRIVIEGNAETA
jgi:hypothetical protein